MERVSCPRVKQAWIWAQSDAPSCPLGGKKSSLYMVSLTALEFPVVSHTGGPPCSLFLWPHPPTSRSNSPGQQDWPIRVFMFSPSTQHRPRPRRECRGAGEGYWGDALASETQASCHLLDHPLFRGGKWGQHSGGTAGSHPFTDLLKVRNAEDECTKCLLAKLSNSPHSSFFGRTFLLNIDLGF